MFNPETMTRSALGSLTLLQLEGIGVKSASSLVEHFETLGMVRDAASRKELGIVLRRVPSSLDDDRAWENAAQSAEQVFDQAGELGVRILSVTDPEYPELLRLLPDRPMVLFVTGCLRSGRKNVACVGTREPSSFGVLVTQRIVEMLVDNQWSIISGLALGIDAEAHRQALAKGGHTVAVLANGLDKVYPREHKSLAAEILDKGGALVSEQAFGVSATPSNLVQRDRLQSGMSVGTIVMQTDVEGGSMHTARFTLTQRRKLFAPVPTGIHASEPKSQGILALTSKTGPELVAVLKTPPDEYASLLRREFASRSPAIPITSRNDYRVVLDTLDSLCESEEKVCGTSTSAEVEVKDGIKPKDTLF